MTATLNAFREAIGKSGLTPPETILADGKIHRFASSADADDDSGWYILFSDGLPAGSFGDWRLDLKQNWCAKHDRHLTPTERADYRARCEAARQQREADERQRHAEAATQARAIWEAAPLAPATHPYLQRKHIQPHGVRLDRDGDLIVPVLIEGELSSLQGIGTDGQKMFLPGGAIKGGSFTLGALSETTTICVCEGFATAGSVFEAVGEPTVCAFSANNLKPVAQQLRGRFPAATILVCGDNDVHDNGTPNVGVKAATEAAQAITGLVVIPDAINNRATDWNDVHVQLGLAVVAGAIEAVLNPREQARRAETARTDNEPGLTKILADEILQTDQFAKDAGGQLYVFDDGCYRPHGEPFIAQQVKALLLANGETKRWSSHRAREVMEYIKVDVPALWERPKPDILNLANGLFSLATGTLTPHTPAHLSPVQLPVTFDPSATCPLWESFITRVLPDDCRTLPYELVGASMRGEVSDQKAVLLVGAGENGKSTLLSAIVAFLGHDNVSTLALQRLEIDKFAVVRLLGKLANICTDLPSDHLASTSTFKALTGGDQMTAERKFQGSFEMRPFARLLFSANFYPQSKDNSRAFFRRWLVLPFETTIEPQERIDKFVDQLADPAELSGVLNRALSLFQKMLSQGGFSQNETTRAAAIEFQEMTDPLAVWLDHSTILSANAMVTRTDLMIVYNAAAGAASRPPMTSKAFCAAVRRLRPTVKEKQRVVHGGMHWVFLGLGMRTPDSAVNRDVERPAPAGLFAEEVVDDDR